MTTLDKKTILHVAELSKLQLTESEVEKYAIELKKILDAFESLSLVEVQSDGAARSGLIKTPELDESASRLRKDVADNKLPINIFLDQSPDRDGNFVRVPLILEKE